MSSIWYDLQLIGKLFLTVTETDADFAEYVQVIEAKIQQVSTRDERLIAR
jgi:hypothetical protein